MRNYGITAAELAEEREILDASAMAEMLYQGFESNVDQLLNERGISLPPPTDMNGRVVPGYEGQMSRAAGHGQNGGYRQNGPMPASSSERAITALMDVREDMLKKYSAVSQDPVMAPTMAMGIQKIEAEIISMGGEVDRFDPSRYQSGLKPVAAQSVDQKVAAEKVVENTKESYTLRPIRQIYAGASKTGKQGICVKIAVSQGLSVRGTVVPKRAFSGGEVIDYVPDSGKGRMTVKAASGGYWEDVSGDFDIAWIVERD